MKERKVRTQDQISISREIKTPDILESSLFDSIDSKEFTKYFTRSYAAHKKFLLQFIASRTALTTAMDNVQALIENELGNSIELKDKQGIVEDKMDRIYESSLALYAIVRSTRFIPEEYRKEVILHLMEQFKVRQTRSGEADIIAALNGQAVRKKDLDGLKDQMDRLIKERPENPYGKLNLKSRKRDPFQQQQEAEPVAGVKRRFRDK